MRPCGEARHIDASVVHMIMQIFKKTAFQALSAFRKSAAIWRTHPISQGVPTFSRRARAPRHLTPLADSQTNSPVPPKPIPLANDRRLSRQTTAWTRMSERSLAPRGRGAQCSPRGQEKASFQKAQSIRPARGRRTRNYSRSEEDMTRKLHPGFHANANGLPLRGSNISIRQGRNHCSKPLARGRGGLPASPMRSSVSRHTAHFEVVDQPVPG